MEVNRLLGPPTKSQVICSPTPRRDPFTLHHKIDATPNFMAYPQPSEQTRTSTTYHNPDNSWDLQFNRMRAQIDDQEAELREKDVQLALLCHRLEEEQLRHAATREALGRKCEGIQRSVDASEVVKAVSALGNTVNELKHQQEEILLQSGGFDGFFFGQLPPGA